MLLDTEVHKRPAPERSMAGPAPLESATTHFAESRESERRRRAPLRSRRPTPFLLMAAGLAVIAMVALVVTPRLAPVSGEAGPAISRPPRPPVSSRLAIGGPSDVVAQMASYAPGQTSGWHSHTGLHAVVVLSGTLTIVDGDCRRHTYHSGDSYVGGRDIHLALNETAAALEMAVTYMFPAGASHARFHVPAAMPAGCEFR